MIGNIFHNNLFFISYFWSKCALWLINRSCISTNTGKKENVDCDTVVTRSTVFFCDPSALFRDWKHYKETFKEEENEHYYGKGGEKGRFIEVNITVHMLRDKKSRNHYSLYVRRRVNSVVVVERLIQWICLQSYYMSWGLLSLIKSKQSIATDLFYSQLGL